MRRRDLLGGLAAAAIAANASAASASPTRRVRPGDAGWPSEAQWQALGRQVGGHLERPTTLYGACAANGASPECGQLLPYLRNPFYIGDQAGGTQVSGWLNAWQPAVSAYAVAAHTTADVVAAVNFARRHNLRVAVKGGGPSYQGTSNAPDSLLIWLHPMHAVEMHDAFVPAGGGTPSPAVTVEAGALWIDAYDVVTTKNGRYVQGGGCTSVGVAGHVQSGGFGSCSKRFGTAAGNLLEAEVVCADGRVRVCNERRNADLFWALKGGGGGSFGVITRVTLRTYDLPENFGWAFGAIHANSDDAFRHLLTQFFAFYAEHLFNDHWGESISIRGDNTLRLSMVSQGLDTEAAQAAWAPFLDWVRASRDCTIVDEVSIGAAPARAWWDAESHRRNHTGAMVFDPRPGAPSHHAWWSGDQDQVSEFLHGYDSIWLSQSLLQSEARTWLVEALFNGSRGMSVGMHFNKGLAGAPDDIIAQARNTATNPGALDSFALVIIATGGPPPYLQIPGHLADLGRAQANAEAVARASEAVRAIGDNGSYVSESDYFNANWSSAFWGSTTRGCAA